MFLLINSFTLLHFVIIIISKQKNKCALKLLPLNDKLEIISKIISFTDPLGVYTVLSTLSQMSKLTSQINNYVIGGGY